MADIFDFSIAIEARDNATAVLDKTLEKFQAVDKAMKKSAARQEKARRQPRDDGGKFKKDAGVGGMASGVDQLFKALETLGNLPDKIAQAFDQTFMDIEDNIRRIAGASLLPITEADKATKDYINTSIDLANKTGSSVLAVSELANALGKASVFLDDDDVKAYGAELVDMSTAFGVAGDRVASFVGNTRFLGLNIRDTLDTAAQTAAEFKVPALIEGLPDILDNVNNLYAEFGDRVVGDTSKITKSFIKQAATASRAYNITMADAINKVMETTQKFVGELDQVEDVMLGLATDFGGGTKALFQLGMNMDEVNDLLKLGQTDAVGFAMAVREAAANKPLLEQRRLLKLIGKEFGGQTKELLLRDDVYKSMLEAQEMADKRSRAGIVSFSDMTKSFRSTGKSAIKVFKNIVEIGKIIVASLFGKVFSKIFKDAAGDLKSFNERLLELKKTMEDPDSIFQTQIVPKLQKVGRALLYVGGAAASLVSIMSLFATKAIITKGLSGFFKFLSPGSLAKSGKGVGLIGRMFGGLGRILGGIAKKILLPVMAIKSIGVALNEMGKVFKDPNATGMDQFKAILKGLAVGIYDFIDGFLFGLPSMLLKEFFPDLGDSVSSGIGGIIDRVFSQETWDMLKNWASNILANVAEWLSKIDMSVVAENITSALVGVAAFVAKVAWNALKGIATGIYNLFTNNITPNVDEANRGLWGNVQNVATQMLYKLVEIGKGILRGLWSGVLAAFGTTKEMVEAKWDLMMVNLRLSYAKWHDYFIGAMEEGYRYWKKFTDFLKSPFSGEGVQELVNEYIYGTDEAVKTLGDAAINFTGWFGADTAQIKNDLEMRRKAFANANDEVKKNMVMTDEAHKRRARDNALFGKRHDRVKAMIDLKSEVAEKENAILKLQKAQMKAAQEKEEREKKNAAAAKKRADEEKKRQEKGLISEKKRNEILSKSAEWAEAVAKADAKVREVRAKALAGGKSRFEADEMAMGEAFKQSKMLKTLGAGIVTRETAKAKPAAKPVPKPVDGTTMAAAGTAAGTGGIAAAVKEAIKEGLQSQQVLVRVETTPELMAKVKRVNMSMLRQVTGVTRTRIGGGK